MTLRATLSGGQPVRHGGSQVPVRVAGAGVTATGITTRTAGTAAMGRRAGRGCPAFRASRGLTCAGGSWRVGRGWMALPLVPA